MSKDSSTFDEKKFKTAKKLGTDLADEFNSSSSDRLKELILNLSKEIEEIETEQQEDPKLNELKEMLKDLNGGYGDAKKDRKLRLKYCVLLLQERGVM